MGKRANSSDGREAASGLTLAGLLTLSPNNKLVNARCEDLLGKMYLEIFAGKSDSRISSFRNGNAPKQHRQAAAYLTSHPEIRAHILGTWMKWQPYPSHFSAGIREILDTTGFDSAGSPEAGASPFTSGLRRSRRCR